MKYNNMDCELITWVHNVHNIIIYNLAIDSQDASLYIIYNACAGLSQATAGNKQQLCLWSDKKLYFQSNTK